MKFNKQFICALLVIAFILAAAVCEGQVLSAPSMGGNLEGNKDFSRNPNFIDAIKQCRKFGTAASPWDENVPVDADGWPIQSGGQGVGSVIFVDQEPGTFSGTYYLELSGRATVQLVASPDCSLSSFSYNSATGKTTGNVIVGSTATQLMLSFKKDVDGAVRDIRLIRPGYTLLDADTQIFTNTLIEQVKNMKIVRFMDWGETNNNNIVTWSERPKMTDATWTIHGVPYEIMIALGNKLNKDIWVCVPAKVDDNFITQMATLFNANLVNNVYIEYSNELWNGMFSQMQYNVGQAEAMVAGGQTFLNWDNVNDKYTWSFRRTGYKLMLISNIFASIFGESKRNIQFRCVLAGQGANIYILNEGLNIVDKFFGAPSQFFYAVAQAPYFQVPNKNETLTKEQVLSKLRVEADQSPKNYQYMQHLVSSRWNRLKMLAYEGGSDTFGPYNKQSKRAAMWDPRMKEITIDYLRYWFSYGFETFSWFTIGAGSFNTPYGTWPLVEHINQLTSPKKEGIEFYAVNNAGVPLNSTFPTCPDEATGATVLNIPAVKHALGTGAGSYLAAPALNSLFHYPIVLTKKGNYNVTVETGTVKANSYLGIYLDGVKLGSVLSNTGGGNTFAFSLPIALPKVTEPKLAMITLKCESDRAYNIRTVRVKKVAAVSE